jgi:hypothetical protein
MEDKVVEKIKNVEEKLKCESQIWLSEVDKHSLVRRISKDSWSSASHFILNYEDGTSKDLDRIRNDGFMYGVIIHVGEDRYQLSSLCFDSQISNFNPKKVSKIEYYFSDNPDLLQFRDLNIVPTKIPDFKFE